MTFNLACSCCETFAHPAAHLKGYTGIVHADGFTGFNGLFGELEWKAPAFAPAFLNLWSLSG